ncbi:unnamed protein product [Amoebophrya sp. A120]|nr:unnamed protein product [Amoebophrya sp. A120]|eukprot:GSA120T00007516001.1
MKDFVRISIGFFCLKKIFFCLVLSSLLVSFWAVSSFSIVVRGIRVAIVFLCLCSMDCVIAFPVFISIRKSSIVLQIDTTSPDLRMC